MEEFLTDAEAIKRNRDVVVPSNIENSINGTCA